MSSIASGSDSDRRKDADQIHSTSPEVRRKQALTHLRDADPVIGRLIREHSDFDPRAWLRELPQMDLFGALLFQVIGQQLSVQSTRRILGRIQEMFNGQLPSPSQLLSLGPEGLRTAGLSRRKIATLRNLAQQFADGRLDEGEMSQLGDDEIEARLTEIPGIGPWTVHGALIIALDRADVVLPGDLALRKVIQRVYGLDHLPSPEEVLSIAEPWRPYRSLATSYLFASAFGSNTLEQ